MMCLEKPIRFLGYQFSGTNAQVCSEDECTACGTTDAVTPGAWINFRCPAGTKGGRVHVTNTEHHIAICEIKIYRAS